MKNLLQCCIIILSIFFGSVAPGWSRSPSYDLVIINARIVDGTGNPWFRGSIAIKDGRVAKVGRFEKAETKYVIDAKGQIVAPGFIDVHTHAEDVYNHPKAQNFVRMGV